MIWYFQVFLQGILISTMPMPDTSNESACLEIVNMAYINMNEAYDINPYGVANDTGAIFLRNDWEFNCSDVRKAIEK